MEPRTSLTVTDEELDNRSRSMAVNTGSKASLDLCKEWFRRCRHEHAECRWHTTEYWFPTRLIELRNGTTCQWRLYIPAVDGPPSSAYMTLSHRWVDQHTPLLTSANHDTHRTWKDITELPATFQDAIRVALQLLVQYIWLDSLCIIQNSPDGEDWDQESRTMQDVYANAACNIVAGDPRSIDGGNSIDGTDLGLFRDRNPGILGGFVVECAWFKSKSPNHVRVLPTNNVTNDLEKSAIYSRGWVLQERLLAARTLHFGKTQIYWFCARTSASESAVLGHRENISRGLSLQVLKDFKYHDVSEVSAIINREDALNRVVRLWMDIVQVYSACDFTFLSDRQVALDGVVSLFQAVIDDRYHAGLWNSRPIASLYWRTARERRADVERIPDAPTWSWTSINTGIEYPWHSRYDKDWSNATSLAKILTIDQAELENLTVTSDAIRLQVYPVLLPSSSPPKFGHASDERNNIPELSEQIGTFSWHPDIEISPDALQMPGIILAPLFAHCIAPDGWAFLEVDGMVLKEVDERPGTFQRVGAFGHTSGLEFDDEYPKFFPIVCDKKEDLQYDAQGCLKISDVRAPWEIWIV